MNISSNYTHSSTFSGIENIFNSQVAVPKNDKVDTYSKLKKYYEETQEKQGFIGKTWNKIKNIFNIKSGSKNVEVLLEEYEKNTGNLEEQEKAIKSVNNYAKSQHIARNTVRNTIACFASSGALNLVSALSKKKIKSENVKLIVEMGAVLLSSMLSATGISKLDAKSANREYSKDEFFNDAEQGAIQGMLSYGIRSFFEMAGLKNIKFINSGIKTILKTFVKTGGVTAPALMDTGFIKIAFRTMNPKERENIDKQIEQKKAKTEKYENYKYFDPTKE